VTLESGSKLSNIEAGAFYGCSSLSSIFLPSGLEDLNGLALAGVNLRDILLADGNCHLKVSRDFVMDVEGISIKRYVGTSATVTIPSHVEQLSAGCFAVCGTISSVMFESGSRLSSIGDQAFWQCSLLSSICLPSSVKTLAHGCFQGCQSLSAVTFESGSQLSCIEDSAFCHCSLLSICILSSVETLGASCFSTCQSLSAVTFESGCKLSSIGDWTFYNCTSLSSICIPSSVNTLGVSCFVNCWTLSTVTFESGSQLSSIGADAFAGCDSLWSISIPSSVETLGPGCFTPPGCCETLIVTFESGSKLSFADLSMFDQGGFVAAVIPSSLRALFHGLVTRGYVSIVEDEGVSSEQSGDID
jgi:hypothetical protein